jgi:hypothetical protein
MPAATAGLLQPPERRQRRTEHASGGPWGGQHAMSQHHCRVCIGLRGFAHVAIAGAVAGVGAAVPSNEADFSCPVCGVAFNGKYKFVFLRPGGLVVSEKVGCEEGWR